MSQSPAQVTCAAPGHVVVGSPLTFATARGAFAAGIECFVRDEHSLRIAGWHSHILGGIKLEVAESDAQDALAILHETAPTG